MRLTRSRLRRAVVIAAGTALVAGSVLTPSPAQAAPIGSTDALVEQLGLATAGSYWDAQLGQMVVTVTDAGTAKSVESTGAVARKVKHSGAELARITATLDAKVSVPGTAWAVDPVSQPGRRLRRPHGHRRRASSRSSRRPSPALGSGARIEQLAGTLQPTHLRRRRHLRRRLPLLAGLQRPQRQHVLLPDRRALHQHRRDLVRNSSHTTVLGTRTGTQLPGQRLRASCATPAARAPRPGTASAARTSPRAGNAVASARRSTAAASTTGIHSGRVTALNATVNYAEGTGLPA